MNTEQRETARIARHRQMARPALVKWDSDHYYVADERLNVSWKEAVKLLVSAVIGLFWILLVLAAIILVGSVGVAPGQWAV